MTSNIVKNKLVINFYSDIIIKLYTIKIILKRALLAKHAKPYNDLHHFSFFFSLPLFILCSRQSGKFNWPENHLHFWPGNVRPLHVFHRSLSICGGLKYLCSLFWSWICCSHNDTLQSFNKISPAT